MDNITIIDLDTYIRTNIYIMKHLPRQGEEFSINGKTGIIQKVSWLQTSTYCFISIYVKFNN